MNSYESTRVKEELEGFKLRSEVRRFMAELLNNQLSEDQDFVARVSFSGDKAGHAISIQVLNGQEYRIIDNNIGVLSFDTKQEFLRGFRQL